MSDVGVDPEEIRRLAKAMLDETLELRDDHGVVLGRVYARNVLAQLGAWLAARHHGLTRPSSRSAATSVRFQTNGVATLEVHRLFDDVPTRPELLAELADIDEIDT